MIEHLSPYPTYKDSGLPWLRSLPSHWDTPRTKTCFRLSAEKSGKNHGLELLSIYTHIGVRPRKDLEERGNKATSTDDYWIVRKGDIVCNKLLAWMGAIGVSNFEGVTSPAYDILRPTRLLIPNFYHYLFRTPLYLQQFKVRSRGIMEMRLRLYFDQFGQIPLVFPPVDEQRAIVTFLDFYDRRIRRYIRAKRQLLALVSEEREAVTNAALNSANANSLRIGAAVERVSRPVCRKADHVYTPIGLLNRGRGIFHKEPTSGGDLGDSTFYWLKQGDLVLSGQFAWEGAVAQAGPKDEGCVATHRYPILRGKSGLLETAFLLSFFKTRLGHVLLNEHARGSAGRNRPLNIGTLLKEKIAIPPLSEQQQVVSLVALEKQLSSSIAKITDRLKEYRDRLIVDVVTGKLDVREAASQLPVEGYGPDTAADDLLEEEDVIDDSELNAEAEEVEA